VLFPGLSGLAKTKFQGFPGLKNPFFQDFPGNVPFKTLVAQGQKCISVINVSALKRISGNAMFN